MLGKRIACTFLFGVWMLGVFVLAAETSIVDQRAAATKQMAAGNFRDAYEGFRKLALDRNNKKPLGSDLASAVNCLRRLGRVAEIDEFREQVVETHATNWRLLSAAAKTLIDGAHHGTIVAGQFHRGNRRGGGRYVDSTERDRVRALQLMRQALPLTAGEADRRALSDFYFDFARFIQYQRSHNAAWRLGYLTDLSKLPDYEQGYRYYDYGYGGGSRGAPVDAEGNPVFHHLPESFEAAKTDGQRWRWMLHQVGVAAADRENEADSIFAGFLRNQFGVQSMRQYAAFFARQAGDEDDKDESGPYALHTLAEDETIAKLATGIKRFKLPDEFNFIRIYQQIAERGKSNYGEQALNTLAQIFEDRRQYPKAADQWRRSIKQYGPGQNGFKPKRLKQIVGNWGRFENAGVQPAGTGGTVEFRFRNGKQVTFEAHRIKVPKLLDDVKAYLKSSPARLNWQQMNIANIGYRLVHQGQQKYVGERVAQWDVDLKPRPAHFDTRITVATPLQEPGAYLLTGKMTDGNTSRVIIWISDTVIVNKRLGSRAYYFVADAVTGKPIAKANVEFFGYRQVRVAKNRYRIDTSNFAELSDADGQVIPDPVDLQKNYQWVAIARTDAGRFAYLGFGGVWYGRTYNQAYNSNKVFVITDRPVYRPLQTAKFKFWVRNARYNAQNVSQFANQTFTVRITNPKGAHVLEKKFESDAFGGFEGEFKLPDDATLGMYGIGIVNRKDVSGGGSFRVEEYKKPEFEVTIDAPDEPVMLGEKIAATVRAKYYFGAPVTEAKVHYKVLRTSHTSRWFPKGKWDWFYGPGYWWFSPDYTWYPGWERWGCKRPSPWWWPRRQDPPEVVLDNEVEIGPDGTVKIEIDTALAKEVHGDQDHRYQITAEVVDQSRRTIVGAGQVLVARKPFQVFGWVHRGHYRVGDVVGAYFKAQTLDQKPVQGKGELTLYQITYGKDAQPVETKVETWKLDTDPQGEAHIQIKAAAAGQYRLSYKVTDKKKHTIEGGYVFNVIGEGLVGAGYRFNDIELLTDRREYKPGDKVRLMINTNRVGGTVVLFLRPTGGVYQPPQILRLKGKSTVHELTVVKKDMPNFFIEAFTVSGAKVFTETREVVVPPVKRVVNVEVQPSAEEYQPGAPAKVKLKLTDLAGKPFAGSTVVSIYDKSVEYISGGTNVAEIKAFFWKWRRSHYPSTYSSVMRSFGNLLRAGEEGMSNLGAFGYLVIDQLSAPGKAGKKAKRRSSDKVVTESESARGYGSNRKMALDNAAPDAQPASAPASGGRGGGGGAGAEQFVQPTVRKKFADTAYWAGAINVGKDGLAEISLTMPENLTTWKIRAWTMGHGTRVGQGEAEIITTKNLLVRMQAPRFFVEKDEVVLSANVHNYLKIAKQVTVVLELEGRTLAPMGSPVQTVKISANGEKRVDWKVKAIKPGMAVVRMKALTDEESDALEMRFPVTVHGMLKTESFTGVIRPNKTSAAINVSVPTQRQINQTRLEVRYSPTLAGAMVDALPYLVSYPHKTTDTTLNRFLPTVITQNILKRMKLDLKAIQKKRTNLNAQEIGDDPQRAKGWKRYKHNPVFDEAEVTRMVKQGVKDLTAMQLSDGGWGWFSGWGEHSGPHTTALVVHGLQLAKANDVALVPGVMQRGVTWLKDYQDSQVQRLKNAPKKKKPYKLHADNIDALVFMVLVDADVVDDAMHGFLYRDRTKLSVYAKALYGLALHKMDDKEKLTMIVRNIDQFLISDDENQTAYLKLPAGSYWWYWWGSETEANSYYLKLLAKTDPRGDKASRLVKYLLNNRKHATYWNSTRDTAVAIESLAEYLRASGEDRPDLTVEVYYDGKKQKEVKVNAENLFSFDNKFVLVGDAVDSGKHKVELRKKGRGPLYFNAYLTNFTLEDFITRAGLELKVNRKYYKLHRQDKRVKVAGSRGQALGQRVEKYRREELANFANLKSGDLVEIELEIDSKNDYEYLVFEDMKAAGFEPADLRSGYNSNPLGAYMELRDERVTFFTKRLARGKHSVSYRVRAEVPGLFSALPTKAYAMYAPELKGNSDEIKLLIED